MSTYILSIDKKKPKDILDFLDEKQPKKGDKVKLVSEDRTIIATGLIAVLFVLGIALAYYFKRKKEHEDTEKILEDIFKDYSTVEEYEKYIKKEYGIIVEHEQDEYDSNWHKLSLQSLSKAYSQDEPDINHIMVKEPNPLYKPNL